MLPNRNLEISEAPQKRSRENQHRPTNVFNDWYHFTYVATG